MTARMNTLKHGTSLARALSGAQFGERHERVIDAPVEKVWEAYHRLTWRELRITKPLMLVRGMSQGVADRPIVEPPSPIVTTYEDVPTYSAGAEVSKPWQLREPEDLGELDLDEVRAFSEPGWVKFGSEWEFIELSGGRTRVVTTTLCEATDRRARRIFRAYWIVIRLGNGVIRRDVLAALDRRARRARTKS